MRWHLPLSHFHQLLSQTDQPFAKGFELGGLEIELFTPQGKDTQQPHDRDEIYIIQQGEAVFSKAGEEVRCAAGDVLFVEAGVEHRFETFSKDFATWVIFWGPEGGHA